MLKSISRVWPPSSVTTSCACPTMPNENVSRSVWHQQEIGYETIMWRFAIIPPEKLVTRSSVRDENCLYSIITHGPKISNRKSRRRATDADIDLYL